MAVDSDTRTGGDREALRRRTVAWVVGIATVGLIFDGYDLVVYGTVVPIYLRDPSQLGPVTPATAGALGSYALVGVLVGALTAGSLGDIIGRRKVMLIAYAWFAIGMGLTALATNTSYFGAMRFLTGIGVGALVGTTGAIVAEFAPRGRKNFFNAITYAGVPVGSMLAALAGILLLPTIGWRGLFLIGAIPLITVLPLAYFKLPESVAWLAARGRIEDARRVSAETGVPIPESAPATPQEDAKPVPAAGRASYAGLFSRDYVFPTILLGLTSAMCLLLVYSLNTWLPELMRRGGFDPTAALSFLLVLNAAAAIGALFASRVADRIGPKPSVAICFLIGAAALLLLTVNLPVALLLLVVAIAGLGTSGTQILIFGFVSNYYRTNVRSAGVAWCAGFGRLGGIGGPLIGGFLIAAGLGFQQIFLILAGIALLGFLLVMLVPVRRRRDLPTVPVEPSSAAGGKPAPAATAADAGAQATP